MGLNSPADTLVAPPPRGIVDPRTGRPAGAGDPVFGEWSSELSDKGFLVTSSEARGMARGGREGLTSESPPRRGARQALSMRSA